MLYNKSSSRFEFNCYLEEEEPVKLSKKASRPELHLRNTFYFSNNSPRNKNEGQKTVECSKMAGGPNALQEHQPVCSQWDN